MPYDMQISGTVVQAQVRALVLPDGMSVPALCLDIMTDTAVPMPVHIEQGFAPGHHAQAHAALRRYPKGTHITAQAPALGVRLVVPNASLIAITTTAPSDPSPQPLLV